MLKPSERLTWCERKAAAIGAVVQLELKLENFMIEKMEKFYDLKNWKNHLCGHAAAEPGVAGLDPLQALTF